MNEKKDICHIFTIFGHAGPLREKAGFIQSIKNNRIRIINDKIHHSCLSLPSCDYDLLRLKYR